VSQMGTERKLRGGNKQRGSELDKEGKLQVKEQNHGGGVMTRRGKRGGGIGKGCCF